MQVWPGQKMLEPGVLHCCATASPSWRIASRRNADFLLALASTITSFSCGAPDLHRNRRRAPPGAKSMRLESLRLYCVDRSRRLYQQAVNGFVRSAGRRSSLSDSGACSIWPKGQSMRTSCSTCAGRMRMAGPSKRGARPGIRESRADIVLFSTRPRRYENADLRWRGRRGVLVLPRRTRRQNRDRGRRGARDARGLVESCPGEQIAVTASPTTSRDSPGTTGASARRNAALLLGHRALPTAARPGERSPHDFALGQQRGLVEVRVLGDGFKAETRAR